MSDKTDFFESFEPLLKPGQIILIGEWHGTNEFPDLVGKLAARCCEHGYSVTIGMEISCSEQDALSKFVGSGLLNQAMLDGPWWHRGSEFQDGRSSQAIARLVHSIATLSHQGHDISVAAVDGPWVAPGSPIDPLSLHLVELPRDQVMASYLLEAIDNRPDSVTIFLSGSSHTRVRPLAKSVQPAGRYLQMWHPNVVALLGRSSGGMAWTLPGDSHEGRPLPVPDNALAESEAMWLAEPGSDGHHGYVNVGRVSASPPYQGGSGMTPPL